MTSTLGQPRVSVLMPLFNSAPYVLDACFSVLSQTVTDIELVVVDDGSTDGSGDLLREVQDPRMRVVTTPHGGETAARNRCLEEAAGEFLTWQDADDISASDRIARQLTAMTAGVDLVHHDALIVDHRGERIGHRRRSAVPADHIKQAALRQRDPILPGTAMLRRSALGDRRLDAEIHFGSVSDLLVRWASLVPSAHLPLPLLHQREHATSVSSTVTVEDASAATSRLLSRETMQTLVPTAFQQGWFSDSEVVAKAFVVLCLERQGFSLDAVKHLDRLPPCSTRDGALMVSALVLLAQDDPAAALRSLAPVKVNAFAAALTGDAHLAQGATAAAQSAYRTALELDPTSFDAISGLRRSGARTKVSPSESA